MLWRDCKITMQSLHLVNRIIIIEKMKNNYYKTETNNYARLYIYRPTINYKRTIVFVSMIGIATLLLSIIVSFLLSQITEAAPSGLFLMTTLFFFLLSIAIFLRRILIWFITLYQATAKIETRLKCCFEPSCSEYATLAIKKYGAIRGSIKTIIRLRRCHPPGGIDYP